MTRLQNNDNIIFTNMLIISKYLEVYFTMKKLLAFLSLLLAFTVVLAACGTGEKEDKKYRQYI